MEPDRVRAVFTQLAARWPAEWPPLAEVVARFHDRGTALAHLLSVSPVSAEKLLADPAALVWLANPEVAQRERGLRRMESDYEERRRADPPGFDPRFRALRQSKAREMLRIAWREVAGASSLEQATLELTILAELCVQTVCDGWLAELSRKSGAPQAEFAVLGMGKFGGEELNYSSDIDVIFFYSEDGQINPRFSFQEFFTRLAEKIVTTFAAADSAGALFRIDLRLRPEGGSGPLVRSLDSMENYYAAFGETWERMAMIKARVVAGSAGAAELGYEFSQRLQAFIYPRTASPDTVDEIRVIKGRIEREIVGRDDLHRNVKLGYGGIREIEFIAQTLQVLHGAKHPFLQERRTLKALRNLEQLDFIPEADMEQLIAAYRFLRTVEHRLQIEQEAQTHTLPESPEALARLAASLGYAGRAAFQRELATHAARVRAIFDAVFGAGVAAGPAADLSFFRAPEPALRALDELGGSGAGARFSPRTKKLFARLEPLLLDWLRRVAEPDTALTGFVRFVERYGGRGLLYETLLTNPRVLEALVRLFDASRFLTEIVLRRPQLLEEIARTATLGETRTVADYLRGLRENDEGLAPHDWVRAFRRAQVLRIGLRDVLGFVGLRELQAEYSALAEACVVFRQRQLGFDAAFSVVAMGKFGGCELGYGADLDVVFVGDDVKAAAEFVRALTETTSQGIVFPVDARLRPEGEGGLLAVSLAGYEAYFEKRAQLWEAQALTKSRPISGSQQREFAEAAQRIWRRFGAREDLFAEVAAMHARVVRERTGGDDLLDFKTGTGGLMQVEFFTQAHQMRGLVWETNTVAALAALARHDALPAETASCLTESYLFLRQIESVLRRVEDKGVSRLPADESAQRAVALRCGFATREDFLAACRAARAEIARRAVL